MGQAAMKIEKRNVCNHYYFDMDDEVVGVLFLSVLKNVLEAEGLSLKGYPGPISDLSDYRKRISLRHLLQTILCSLESAPPGIGLRYGRELNVVAADTLGQLIMSCRDLGSALDYMRQYRLLLAISFDIESEFSGPYASLKVGRFYGKKLPLALQHFASETLYACVMYQARWLTGQNLKYQSLCFPYAEPAHVKQYQTAFDCELKFEEPKHRLSFERRYFSVPIQSANAQVEHLKAVECREALARWQSRFSVTKRVNAILAQTYPDFPSIDKVASLLNTSRSCLYRKLQESQTSYQHLINEFKREQSMRLLRETLLSVTEVAEKLGFSDASSFRRAFKGWTGMQPSAVRAQRQMT